MAGMYRVVNRRDFLKGAVAGAGSLALGVVIATRQHKVSSQALQASSGTEFVGGTVLEVGENTIVTGRSGGILDRILVSPATRIWKGEDTDIGHVAPGDFIYARAVRLPDAALAAVSMWVNIAQVFGKITTVGRGSFQVLSETRALGRPSIERIVLTNAKTLYLRSPGAARQGAFELVKQGLLVQALGVGEKDGRTLHATRIWLSP